MKNIYLLFFLAAIFVSSTAQIITPELTKKDHRIVSKHETSVVSSSYSATAATVIWQNDCSDAADWIFTNSSIPAPGGTPLDWRIETNTDLNAIQVTPLPSSLYPFASNTASNGFLFISSDAEPLNADNNNTPIEAWSTIANPIDLSAWPYVQLTFEHNYRWWQDTRSIRISKDDGSSWTEFPVTSLVGGVVPDGYPHLQNTSNPEVTTYNISAIAGGQDSVLVQIYYFDNDMWGWWWAVDDIRIETIPDNLLVIDTATHGGWYSSNPTTTGDIGWDYTFNPLSQLSLNPYEFGSVIRNLGIAPQNTTLNVEVLNDFGAVVYSDVSNTTLLPSFTQDNFITNSTFTPNSTGVYYISMWGTGDSASTNISSLQTIVTDYVYGRDNDNPDGWWRVGRPCGGQELGVSYDIYNDVSLSAIQAHIDDQSVVGSEFVAKLYEDDIANPSANPIYIIETDVYTITSSDLGNWVTIPFAGGEQLYAGTSYIAVIAGYANPIDTFQVSTSSGQEGGCYIQDNGCNFNSANPIGTWYNATGGIPMIRMSFDPSATSIDNVISGEFNVYPNPNNGVFTIELNNIKADDYKISITNVLGQEVYTSTKEISTLISEKVDLSELRKGVYILEVSNSESTITEKIIVE